MPREIITLQCTECKNKNYSTTENKKTTTERLELNKFCRKIRVIRRIRKLSNCVISKSGNCVI